jgi:hypothetical protein
VELHRGREEAAAQDLRQDVSAPLAAAERRFGQVLSLYPESAAPRAVWAAYMLGQVHAVRAARAGTDGRKEIEAAARFFALARTRAAKGDPDPDALAVASYGEEARLYLSAHGCGWADFLNGSNCPAAIAPADLKRMIALYAQQASRGSAGAVSSLAAIAGWSLRDGARAAALIDDPVAQRLLVAYALPRAQASAPESGQEQGTAPLAALVRAADARGLDHVQDADRLAALAYGVGLYDVAGRFLATAQGPLAQWVNAKLQLRRGDMAGAALSYARAAKAFPQVPDGLSPGNNRLIKGEQGVLSLARGEYVEALSALYDAALAGEADADVAYDQDAFYIADRVLMTDELKRFVDARAPEPPALGPEDARWSDAGITVPLHLRWLLARRLMREDRRGEALAYYPASLPPGVTEVDIRASARTYAGSLSRADSAWTDTGKARALYAAAVTARKAGMEILGYEQEPDYAAVQGVYDFGYGRPADWCAVVTTNPDNTVTRTPGPPTSPYTTKDECQRYNATMARPDYRYHYRYVAADLATRAANHLPRRSQAYAAVLCKAVGWTLTGQGDTARTLYRRYVAEGAYVPWAANFGRHCQEPDFGAARWFTARQAWKAARHWTRVNWYVPLAAAIGLAALVIALARRRRAA